MVVTSSRVRKVFLHGLLQLLNVGPSHCPKTPHTNYLVMWPTSQKSGDLILLVPNLRVKSHGVPVVSSCTFYCNMMRVCFVFTPTVPVMLLMMSNNGLNSRLYSTWTCKETSITSTYIMKFLSPSPPPPRPTLSCCVFHNRYK